jgi:hypothetical protein
MLCDNYTIAFPIFQGKYLLQEIHLTALLTCAILTERRTLMLNGGGDYGEEHTAVLVKRF